MVGKKLWTYADIADAPPKKIWKDLKRTCGLTACFKFYTLTDDEIRRTCNGMGAKDSPFNALIPNTAYGLDFSIISTDHDIEYRYGENRLEADERFRDNGYKLVNCFSKYRWLAWLRRRRIDFYYDVLRVGGGNAWTEGHKNK